MRDHTLSVLLDSKVQDLPFIVSSIKEKGCKRAAVFGVNWTEKNYLETRNVSIRRGNYQRKR